MVRGRVKLEKSSILSGFNLKILTFKGSLDVRHYLERQYQNVNILEDLLLLTCILESLIKINQKIFL